MSYSREKILYGFSYKWSYLEPFLVNQFCSPLSLYLFVQTYLTKYVCYWEILEHFSPNLYSHELVSNLFNIITLGTYSPGATRLGQIQQIQDLWVDSNSNHTFLAQFSNDYAIGTLTYYSHKTCRQ